MSRPTGLLRIRQVLARIPVSRAYFYELISADERIRPIKFGSLSFWTAEQIDALERRIRDGTAKRRHPRPANTPSSNSLPPPH
jgi:predicted DNA-binding transcriptional regulator AlpA